MTHFRLFAASAVLIACCAVSARAAVAKPICGGSTSSKNVELLTPRNPPRECIYHIDAYSSNVCQLRVEFAMTLAQPTEPTDENGLPYVQCVDDYFLVNGLRLCGNETNQHVYVPFNRTAGVKTVDLRIVMAPRNGANNRLPTPDWYMLVTQLECPAGASVRAADVAESSDATPEARAATINDGFFVAPPGCLQYFPEAAGVITSFNYNNGEGMYPGHMNYAICFRRNAYTRALQLKTHYFKLGSEFTHMKFLELDNYCIPQMRTAGANEDYLMIPQSIIEENNIRATFFCGGSVQGDTIISTNPGPLMMIFNSDGNYKNENEGGFAFTYRVV